MSTLWKLSLVALLVIAGSFTVSRYVGSADQTSGSSDPSVPPAERKNPRMVVGFGHVDVEEGTVPLSLPMIGQVDEVLVKEGESISAGDPLVRLYRAQAEARKKQAEAAVREAEVRLEQAKEAPDNHRLEIDRQEQAISIAHSRALAHQRQVDKLEKLNQENAIPEENLLSAKDRLLELKAAHAVEVISLDQLRRVDPQETIELAEAALDSARAQLEMAQDQLDRHTLHAPQDGIILRILISRGQMLGADQRQPAVWFCPDGPRIVRCEIDQEYADRVSPGMVAEIYLERHATQPWTGKVKRCADWISNRRSLLDEPFQRNDVRTLECIISLDPGQRGLRIGQRMRVVITEKKTRNPKSEIRNGAKLTQSE